jgi:hypothetical protein
MFSRVFDDSPEYHQSFRNGKTGDRRNVLQFFGRRPENCRISYVERNQGGGWPIQSRSVRLSGATMLPRVPRVSSPGLRPATNYKQPTTTSHAPRRGKLGTDRTFTNFHSSKNWGTFRLSSGFPRVSDRPRGSDRCWLEYHRLPTARQVQEFVTVWKQLRKWL